MIHAQSQIDLPNWTAIRQNYPYFEEAIYLSTNSGGLISRALLQKINQLYEELARKGSQVWLDWPPLVEEARNQVGAMVQAHPEGVAFIQNVSMGFQLLDGLLPQDSSILYFEDEFPAGVIPWKHRGYEMTKVPSQADGQISLDNLADYVAPNTRMLLASHVMYKTGYRMDLKSLGDFCQAHGLLFLVDATQSAGMFELRCEDWNIDILLFSGYKWLNAGYGVGAMYLRPELIKERDFKALGWKSVTYDKLYELVDNEMLPGARRFELGHPDFVRVQALGEAIRQLDNIGFAHIQNRLGELLAHTYKLCQENDIPILSFFPPEHRSGILRLPHFGISLDRFAEAGFRVRVRDNTLTLGISFYNTPEDLEQLFQFIKEQR